MKVVQVFFRMLAEYQQLKFDLKERFIRLKYELKIYYLNNYVKKMKIDREALETLVRGSEPTYSKFDNPLVKKAGHSYNDQYGRTNWSNLKDLTDEELYELYEICKR